MTNGEIIALETISTRIKELASLENAGFSFSKEEDAKIKDKIRPYMMWFDSVSYALDDLIKAVRDNDKYGKQNAIDYIARYL